MGARLPNHYLAGHAGAPASIRGSSFSRLSTPMRDSAVSFTISSISEIAGPATKTTDFTKIVNGAMGCHGDLTNNEDFIHILMVVSPDLTCKNTVVSSQKLQGFTNNNGIYIYLIHQHEDPIEKIWRSGYPDLHLSMKWAKDIWICREFQVTKPADGPVARKSQQNLFQGTFKRCDLNSTPKSSQVCCFQSVSQIPYRHHLRKFPFFFGQNPSKFNGFGMQCAYNDPPISLIRVPPSVPL